MIASFVRLAAVAVLLPFAVVSPCRPAQEGADLPFHLPTPDGWRTETIPFPLAFAPDLPYVGLEELRFAPGMFEQGSEEFWSYAFVWWVGPDEPHDLETMAGYLEDYFRGLARAVAREFRRMMTDPDRGVRGAVGKHFWVTGKGAGITDAKLIAQLKR